MIDVVDNTEVAPSRSEVRYLDRKDNFTGFKEVEGKGVSELREHLGIPLSEVRTFHYQGEPRLASVRRKFGVPDNRINRFVENSMHRGFYDAEQDAVFMRPNDPFAEVHELGHAFVEKRNSDLVDFYAEGRMGASGVEERIAALATDEGVAQWMAIATGLSTKDPERVKKAIWESNRLVADENVSDGFDYDPQVVVQKLATVKRLIADYVGNPAVQRKGNPIVAQEQYKALLDNNDLYWAAMSLGYVYTMDRLSDASAYGKKTAEVLAGIVKTPPTLAEMEERVLSFNGPVDFQNIRS